jgi:uncharacterized membrane protein
MRTLGTTSKQWPRRHSTSPVNLTAAIHKRIQAFGSLPLCSLKSGSAPQAFGFVCPLCWRCAGALVGVLGARAFLPTASPALLYTVAALVGVCVLDVVSDRFGISPTTNVRRFVTGILLGAGIGSLRIIFYPHHV